MMIKYKEVASSIKQKILNLEYKSGSPLPDQTTLANEYNTSRVTIQKALNLLSIEGIIFTRQGSGTYVRRNTLDISPYDSFSDEYSGLTKRLEKNVKVSSKTISFEARFPTEKERDMLLIEMETPIYDIIRLRYLDNEPYLIEYTIMPVNLIPNVNEKILQKSIYSYIQEELGLKIGGTNRKIRADRPNQYEEEYLDCKETDPILEVEQVVYLSNGVPFEYSKSRRRYDKGDIIVLSTHSSK